MKMNSKINGHWLQLFLTWPSSSVVRYLKLERRHDAISVITIPNTTATPEMRYAIFQYSPISDSSNH